MIKQQQIQESQQGLKIDHIISKIDAQQQHFIHKLLSFNRNELIFQPLNNQKPFASEIIAQNKGENAIQLSVASNYPHQIIINPEKVVLNVGQTRKINFFLNVSYKGNKPLMNELYMRGQDIFVYFTWHQRHQDQKQVQQCNIYKYGMKVEVFQTKSVILQSSQTPISIQNDPNLLSLKDITHLSSKKSLIQKQITTQKQLLQNGVDSLKRNKNKTLLTPIVLVLVSVISFILGYITY